MYLNIETFVEPLWNSWEEMHIQLLLCKWFYLALSYDTLFNEEIQLKLLFYKWFYLTLSYDILFNEEIQVTLLLSKWFYPALSYDTLINGEIQVNPLLCKWFYSALSNNKLINKSRHFKTHIPILFTQLPIYSWILFKVLQGKEHLSNE